MPSSEKQKPIENFEKNFYDQYIIKSDDNPTLNSEEVKKFYEENEIKVSNSDVAPIFNFSKIKLPHAVMDLFNDKKFTHPTPIQSQGWPIALKGDDMVGIAQTGSGKSLSFIIPALINLYENHKKGNDVVTLVLAPTRELIVQISEIVDQLSYEFKVKTALLYGGVSAYNQRRDLQNGASFICATPGRLLDLASQNIVPLHRVSYLVLDEADRMLDMGFEPQLRKIVELLPESRQTLMWSATWPDSVRRLAETYMKNYSQIRIGGNELVSNKRIDQKIVVTSNNEKMHQFFDFLKENEKEKTIVFCNTKRECDNLERELHYNKDIRARGSAIHGDKSQNVRDRIINDFKVGRSNILIATDVAARGLDVKDVTRVFNYDMPNNCEQYVHRVGRTGRGGKTGAAVTLFTSADSGMARELVKMLQKSDQKVCERLGEMARNSGRGGGNSGRGGYGGRKPRGGYGGRY